MTFSQTVQAVCDKVASTKGTWSWASVCLAATNTMADGGMDPTQAAIEAVAKCVWQEVPAARLRF